MALSLRRPLHGVKKRGIDGGGEEVCVFDAGGGMKAGLERRVPLSVIINLSGMQLLFLPDKLLHGYSALAACQVAFPSTDLSLFLAHTCTHTCTDHL